jgi:hypothetical protein
MVVSLAFFKRDSVINLRFAEDLGKTKGQQASNQADKHAPDE